MSLPKGRFIPITESEAAGFPLRIARLTVVYHWHPSQLTRWSACPSSQISRSNAAYTVVWASWNHATWRIWDRFVQPFGSATHSPWTNLSFRRSSYIEGEPLTSFRRSGQPWLEPLHAWPLHDSHPPPRVDNEVAFLLYSTNTFYIRYEEASGLQPLLGLSSGSLQAMRSLQIDLIVASYVEWACSKYTDGEYPWSSVPYDQPLACSTMEGQRRLRDWDQAAQHLGTYIQSNRLDLAFSCDCADLATAQLVVGILLGRIRPLATCSIRLRRHRDVEIQRLVRDYVMLARVIRKSQSIW